MTDQILKPGQLWGFTCTIMHEYAMILIVSDEFRDHESCVAAHAIHWIMNADEKQSCSLRRTVISANIVKKFWQLLEDG